MNFTGTFELPAFLNPSATQLIRRFSGLSTLQTKMNATISNGGKVHRIIDGFARCGVGRNAKARTWQMEFCAVTCQRCVKLEKQPTKVKGATPQRE